MIKLTGSRSTFSRIATILLLLFSVSILFYSQFQTAPMGVSAGTSLVFSLFSPSSSTVMVLAQPSNESNTAMGNILKGNSNNESAGANTTGMQSNQTGNSTNTARWISLGPVPQEQVTQSNGSASNSITSAASATTNADNQGVQITENSFATASANQTPANSENKDTGGVNIRPITKEEARKADQEANVMIKAYYEKVEKEKQESAAIEAAQANQTASASVSASQMTGSAGDELDESEEVQDGGDGAETNGEDGENGETEDANQEEEDEGQEEGDDDE